ncbi:hypothetical protein M413DRAFT_30103 [Hebeloma cylindrosporum]|uniref:Uncharacterized protein n=1 Tax=Hebeloma cylindrosporum TaxID=76867 RepID=A0A0C3C4N3_HEBCY|nr:hypothetical protein M413DRAFT_30103 [Hebeloma cylindrosporum h7]
MPITRIEYGENQVQIKSIDFECDHLYICVSQLNTTTHSAYEPVLLDHAHSYSLKTQRVSGEELALAHDHQQTSCSMAPMNLCDGMMNGSEGDNQSKAPRASSSLDGSYQVLEGKSGQDGPRPGPEFSEHVHTRGDWKKDTGPLKRGEITESCSEMAAGTSVCELDRSYVRINAALFLSLTLCLTTVLIWYSLPPVASGVPKRRSSAPQRYPRPPPDALRRVVTLARPLNPFYTSNSPEIFPHPVILSAAVSVVVLFLAATNALPAIQHAFTKYKHLRVSALSLLISTEPRLFYNMGALSDIQFIQFAMVQVRLASFSRASSKSAADLNWMTFDMRGRQFRERSGDRSPDREEVE